MARVRDEVTKSLIDQLSGRSEDKDLDRRRAKWRKDPILWASERMGVDPRAFYWDRYGYPADFVWDGTPNPLAKVAEALGKGLDVAIEAGTGTSKTWSAALFCLWFLDCFYPAEVITTAPREKQLTSNLWKEIGIFWPRFQELYPKADLKKLLIRMKPGREEWKAEGVTAGVGASEDSATKMQGYHSKNMLFVIEECPGVHSAIMTAIDNTCIAPNNLRLGLGNPDHQQDSLHRLSQEPGVVPVRISALDYPNVVLDDPELIPGAVSLKKVVKRRKQYGEGSRLYQSRVRGISPAESKDALIRWEWLMDAVDKTFEDDEDMTPALGVDVANSENGDQASISHWRGPHMTEIQAFQCPDANALGRDSVKPLIEAYELTHLTERVGVDSIGVGAGTVNELKRLGFRIAALDGSAKPVKRRGDSEVYRNFRSQMWWTLREDLRNGRVKLPFDDELFRDLAAPTWTTSNGKIVVESKPDIKKRLGRSPNKGDGTVYGNWVRQKRGGSSQGGRQVDL